MKLKKLQTKYPEFIYESFAYELKDGDLAVSFEFKVPPDIEFNPRIVIKNVSQAQLEKIGERQMANLVFHLGLCEIPTYWKATCSPAIVIKAGYLDKTQIKFWQDLIKNGMVQFFYENKLPFVTPKLEIKCANPAKTPIIAQKFSDRFLVPMGGGKDSLVTLELLREAGKETATFVLNPSEPVRQLLDIAGGQVIEVWRTIDKRLIELNQQGFLNGHTPFSSILAYLSVALAALLDYKFVAISQERSSNEGNVKYLGKTVNHQYSKSFDFENKFRAYSKKYLAKNIEYFSFLRPLYELQIARIFSNYSKYFPVFLSCNKSFTIAARQAGASGWCGNCPKCLFTFAALYPFIGKEAAEKIIGRNLFEQKELLPIMLELVGEGTCKPFECVGTFAEARAAFYLSLQKSGATKPYLLEYFEKNIMPKYPKISQESNKLLSSWDLSNNIPQYLVGGLKKSLKGTGLDK